MSTHALKTDTRSMLYAIARFMGDYRACGRMLTLDEASALDAVPPSRVTFVAREGADHGDIWLDTYDTGGGSRSDAEATALYFGTVLCDYVVEAEDAPRHPRREAR